MTSSSDTFPFGIADVVELLGLTVRRRLPSSLYLNCPFCGDQRGRLNVNTDKNVWRCNRCGAAGGMLALYARYNCTSNADAYREICEALGRYTPRPRVNDCIGVKPEQNARATPQEIHQTYSLLLSMLPLTPTHKAHLLSPRRGLTEEQIARFGFKSTPPAFLCRSYAERLRRQGCTLQGVMQASMNRVSQDTERLTRRNMKLCVMEDVQTECLADPAFARLVMNPKKKMVNCFHYINRKAREYLEQEMKDNDEKPMGGGFGGDVPDELCYQWAREYFRDADAKEDAEPEEKFVPKTYNGKVSKAGKGKKDKPKKAAPKPAPKPAEEEQLTFGDFGTEEAAG